MQTRGRATLDDLRRVPGKAELVGGKIVFMTPAGGTHGYVADAEPALPGWSMPVDDLFPREG